ncbi:ethylene-responsive transcription factor ERF084-like [Aegilops tauschii subsp. strangulata]|uniref:ethylene-responsive transcription factor ERF084-like n=1 Tax=Aegilops tauschii subsp. strangulata TaxID=200361 RepID=UPI00098A3BE1|nr:ethylene-responsive transcription factor ERF084-like [Aegilops tauschii subsp. strangulata]
MPPKKLMKGKTGFFGVRAKPSGHFSMKFTDVGHRFWLGSYPTAHEAARAYDVAGIRMEEIPKKKANKRPAIVIGPRDSDEAAMANLEYVQAEQEYFWKHDAEQKEEEEEAAPSMVVPVESSEED